MARLTSFVQVKTNMDFEIVQREECEVSGDREEMFSKLEQDIISQVAAPIVLSLLLLHAGEDVHDQQNLLQGGW